MKNATALEIYSNAKDLRIVVWADNKENEFGFMVCRGSVDKRSFLFASECFSRIGAINFLKFILKEVVTTCEKIMGKDPKFLTMEMIDHIVLSLQKNDEQKCFEHC